MEYDRRRGVVLTERKGMEVSESVFYGYFSVVVVVVIVHFHKPQPLVLRASLIMNE